MSPASRSLRRSSLRTQVLDALRDALAAGELRPGTLHSAPELAERFDVSATPVREAMLQLVREGSVRAVPNKGFRVVGRTVREQAELAELRAMLEGPAAARAVARAGTERLDVLRGLADEGVRAASSVDRAGWVRAELEFHRELLESVGNHELSRTAAELHRRALGPEETPRYPPDQAAGWRVAADEHLTLVRLLWQQDTAAVETLMRAHCAAAARERATP